MNVDTAYLLLHDASVDLTHITAPVTLLHLTDVQLPCTVIVMRHADPRIVRHDLVVKRQDSLVLRLKPAHLQHRRQHITVKRKVNPQHIYYNQHYAHD